MFLCTCDSGAASIKLCQVLVEFGMTNPKSKFHSSKHRPLNRTFCSILNFSIGSIDEKLISLNNGFKTLDLNTGLWLAHLDTALHLSIFLGTLASCSSSGMLRSSFPCNKSRSGTSFSISGSPATVSSPCLRHGGSSNSLGIPTRCLLLWLAFCESVKLWRWGPFF